MTHVDAVSAPRAPDRPVAYREDHALALVEPDDLGPRLHARPLLGQDEFAPREVDVRPREQERDLEREDVIAVEVLVEGVVVARPRNGAAAASAWSGPPRGSGRGTPCARSGSDPRFPSPRSSDWRSPRAADRARSAIRR